MLASRQPIVASVLRDAWIEVDLGAIEHNVKIVRGLLGPDTKLMGVVKSDAYGHGAAAVSELLVASGTDFLGVASIDEGTQLRQSGIACPILLLSPCPSWALEAAIEAELQLTVTNETEVKPIAEAALSLKRIAKVHVKVDSGMHRLGVSPQKALCLLKKIDSYKQIKLIGIFSHLAKADNKEATARQNKIFNEVVAQAGQEGFKPELLHLASSDATRFFPDTHYDMVRAGVILYGLEARSVSTIVKPAMSVRGRINHLQEVEEGQSAGYDFTWTASRLSRLASIPIGYADGIDRRLSNSMQASCLGKRICQVGQISMDQMLFDVTDVPDAQLSDVITLIGCDSEFAEQGPGRHDNTLYLADWAVHLDTITYELVCRLRARMPRIYTRHKVAAAKGQR